MHIDNDDDEASGGAGAQSVTVNTTDCGFGLTRGNEILNFFGVKTKCGVEFRH